PAPTGRQDPGAEAARPGRVRGTRPPFRESHSLAVIVATPAIPALDTLAAVAEGVVLVGPPTRLRELPNIIATLPEERAAGVSHSFTGSMPAATRMPDEPAPQADADLGVSSSTGTPASADAGARPEAAAVPAAPSGDGEPASDSAGSSADDSAQATV